MPVTRFEEPRFAKDFAMTVQMRRASLSVMNNIAEGFERYRRNEFMQFLSTSKGSAGEIRSMLYAALDVGYLEEREFNSLLAQAEELGRFIGSFRAGLEKSPPKALATKPATNRRSDSGPRTSGLRTP